MIKPYLIAEIGINHNGDINIAKKLIKNSKECGFDAVKFQKRTLDIVYDKKTLDTPRQSPWGETTREQKLGLEFERQEYDEIDIYCKEIDIEWFASAWDIKSLEFLDKYMLKYNKIASAMIVDHNFLNEVAKKNKHTFISTGMSTKEDIDNASFQGVNNDFGHKGQNYSLFKFKGGIYCGHYWQEELYRMKDKTEKYISRGKEVNSIPNEYQPKGKEYQDAGIAPTDMKDRGAYPN